MSVRLTILALFLRATMLSAETVSERLDRLESEVAQLKVILQKKVSDEPAENFSPELTRRDIGNQIYRISSGDSYWSIAQRYKTTVPALQFANPGVNPFKLKIGAKISVPKPRSPQTPPSKTKTYRVKRGDMLGRISKAHGIALHQVIRANPGLNPEILTIGSILNIPIASSKPSPVVNVKIVAKTPRPLVEPKPPTQSTKNPGSKISALGGYKKKEIGILEKIHLKKPHLVVIEQDLRLFQIAERHKTTVNDLNRLNECNLSPRQMIKEGSQFYVLAH